MASNFSQPDRRAQNENATVPEIVAGFEIAAGGGLIRFFRKALKCAGALAQIGAALDITKPGFGRVGHDAESDDLALFGVSQRLA